MFLFVSHQPELMSNTQSSVHVTSLSLKYYFFIGDPKNVDCSPRKRPEMLEITSFDDAARVVYRGSRGIEILPGPEYVDYSPRKRSEMLKIPS